MKPVTIISEQLIGGSGNWKVYECSLAERNDPVILRKRENVSESTIDSNIEKYRLVQSLGLPTLQYFEKHLLDGNWVILTEHLNKGEILYVSPNSVKRDVDFQLELLRPDFPQKEERIKPVCKAEQHLCENKLSTITNLSVFIAEYLNTLQLVADSRIFIYSDAYFFGVFGNEIVNYRIADFDNIEVYPNNPANECYEANIIEFKSSLYQFIEHFIEEANQPALVAIVDELIAENEV